jgi:sugar O-acyltransferase (sialic acid O-acetyltransferase NeuD family)
LNLFIYGAGGHAKVVAESAISLKEFSKIIFIDDKAQSKDFLRKDKNFSMVSESEIPENLDDANAIIGIGDNQIRQGIAKRCSKIPFISVVSPNAIISKFAEISVGSFISSGAIVNADSYIGKHTIINTGSVIEHDCMIGDLCHIGPGSSIAGGVKLDKNIFIGGGAYINPQVSICSNVIVGSGSLVIHDIQESGTYIGSPVKKIK